MCRHFWTSSLLLATAGVALGGCLDLAPGFDGSGLHEREQIVQRGPMPLPQPVPVESSDGGTADGGIDAGAPPTPQGCGAYEPNNTVATATSLAAGSYPGLAICGNELDLYRLNIPALSVVTATIHFNGAAGDLDLYLSDGSVDAQGHLSAYAASAEREGNEEQILNEPHPQAKTAYLIVAGHSGAQGSYDLTLSIGPGVADRDCFSGCRDLVQLTGATNWGTAQAKTDGYYVYTPAKYAWGRRDLLGLLRYATHAVQARFPATQSDTVAVSDICQQDGLTPGSDQNSPRHPTSTHVRGKDVDVAYFQTDGKSNYQVICGDGSDTNGNGAGGKFNDGSFCTTSQNIVDVPREVYFLSRLAESPLYRVVGVDQTLVPAFQAEALRLYQAKEIGVQQYRRITDGLGFGAAGGWQFHHHHIHLSLYE